MTSTPPTSEQDAVLQEVDEEVSPSTHPSDATTTRVHDPFAASKDSMFDRYDVTVDAETGDRGTQIKLFSLKRPHMRAFHCAWFSFFLAFVIWFAPAPLLPEIRDTLGLKNRDIWTASITNDIMAIVLRTLIGPICDSHGARWPMAAVLVLASIPTFMVGLVESAAGLATLRFFIGIAGSSFVMAQFWPSRMFAQEIAGTANGLVAGWGNLGGAFTQVFMGSILFPTFRDYYDGDSEKAWRTICVIPASVALCWGLILPFLSDDAPMGNYAEMKRRGTMDRVFFTTSLRQAAVVNTWILYVQYACSFGVELVMNNAAVLYYVDKFGLSTAEASTYGFVFGSMNLFARGVGGFISDRLNLKWNGLRGRLWLTALLLVAEGTLILIFAFTDTLGGSVAVMCAFSIFTQAAEGAIYGIVPYVSRLYTGSVSGLVGAGGNVGSVVFGLGFRSMSYRNGFCLMGAIAIASSLLSLFINIPCHAGMIRGQDNHAVIQARERYLRRKEMERQHLAALAAANTSGTGVEMANVETNDSNHSAPQDGVEGGGAGNATNDNEDSPA